MMNKLSFKFLFAIGLMWLSSSVLAFTSLAKNLSTSPVTVRFYNTNSQGGAMTQVGGDVAIAVGQSRSFTGTYAGEYYVRNDGVDPVWVWIVSGEYEGDYGILYSGNGVYSVFVGGGATLEVRTAAPSQCASTPLKWGTGNFCSATPGLTANGGTANLTNTSAGASGSATASCSSGAWSITAASCTANLTVPVGLFATDGANASSISLSWGSSAGASLYRLQQRKQGTTTWTDLSASSATSYNWSSLSDEGVFEFQVRAENSLGASSWSAIETGFIQPKIAPLFVSQAGIPAKIGVGQSFNFTQTWRNNGSETWTGGAHGTAPFNPANTSVWGLGNVAFTGSTATNASVTTSLTVTAPATAGTYPLQRIFQKSGTTYGVASTLVNVVVVDTPACTGVTPNITTTYNPNGSFTVNLVGAYSVESATVKAWGNINGRDDERSYPMTGSGSSWSVTIPVANHYSTGETQISFEALVANSLFTARVCASNSVVFQNLPVPSVTLTPTVGSYTLSGSTQGFVASRSNGEYAKVAVDLGAFNAMKTKVEFIAEDTSAYGVNLNNLPTGVATSMTMLSNLYSDAVPAWTRYTGTVRVTYADPEAALQGKVALVPVSVDVAPKSMTVTASGNLGMPPSVDAKVHVANAYDSAAHGQFLGGLFVNSSNDVVMPFANTGAQGDWRASGLDYASLYDKQLVAIARAVPPSGVTLIAPIEFKSAVFTLPVQAPASVDATDGTREDDVKVTWPAVATGSSIRYRVFRDGTEISNPTGIPAAEFIDVPPARGVTYTYSVKTMVGLASSDNQAQDGGFMPSCRAARLVGATLNADMTAISGLIERWECLTESTATGAIDSGSPLPVNIAGATSYRSFSHALDAALADGAHVLHLGIESQGVAINASRTYDIPFTLSRSAISIKNLTIIYDGATAQQGLEASSIGRFGVRMDGGAGLGFAEETK